MKKLVIIVVILAVLTFGVKTFLNNCGHTTTVATLASDEHFLDTREVLIPEMEIGR